MTFRLAHKGAVPGDPVIVDLVGLTASAGYDHPVSVQVESQEVED